MLLDKNYHYIGLDPAITIKQNTKKFIKYESLI